VDVEEHMRGIGQMARECGLTVSALRFYDGAGVLVPAKVDPHSNYRWYSDEQVHTARLVARLRRVGMPLADICRVLEHRRDRPVVDAILQAHLTRLEDGLTDARRELLHARSLLDLESPMTTPSRLTTTAAELRTAVRAVRFAVGTDPELPMLTGVLLDVDDAAARLAASDRYRLAVSTLAGAQLDGPPVSAILPVALVDELLAQLADDGAVTIEVSGNELAVDAGGRTLRGQRIDSDFPDYRRLLRDSAAHRVDVDTEHLRAELTDAPTRVVRREEDGSDHEVSVLTLGSDGSLTFAPGTAGLVEMGLNREFLLQALDAGRGGQLVLELDGPIAPLAIRDPERAGDVSMLMPVRLT
jgi:DNA-binding transcriptional MerR regulator